MTLAGLSIVEHQPPAITFEPRPGLRSVSNVSAVGRIRRRQVVRGIFGGNAPLVPAGDRDGEDVAVSRSRFILVGVAREGEFLRIRRESIVGWSAKAEGRCVVVTRGEVATLAAL